ncbi:restriction endonuclease subunit S [Vibrio parahaemolyticus]|uniref:restriction endonuclease subunit S n=1 Tax=Vibrio parahaemolyticus TaxID=670 RepID=UPI0011221983|nr:restriction endonuclease subunit S [Vibrio parahaemolyticus]EJB8586711.1 restriction endonuclease subunit S [Vibrio parahaemolyticus]MDF4951428.1 restriction endonuclease subunit S [Vibrio parahaemolyticus]MDF5123971.1 restriction endonuclease subunit S [Vibrio parahaemolyticus]MDF5527501.1 restriction endonuclease subunit S [Vibrio parahaemolyticus]MDF5538247.1 restriction endonuclease subunit S [Vibrio parahaemolyticus]
MKEQMNVPKLRFDEFDTQWKPMPLGEITSYLKGFAFKSEDYLSSGHADSRLIRVSDLSSESVKIDNQKVFLPKELMESSTKYKLKDDDVLITTVGSKPELRESAVGRAIYINKAHGYLNQNLLIMRPKGEHLPRFIFSQLNTPRYINHITNIQRGNANQSNITVVDLFEYRVSTTSLPEQQKIASFLSKVDEKIALLTEKKDKLTEYKKGVMQQLFNGKWDEQDGQLIFIPPTLRFKADDGSEFPDWEEKKLGDLFSISAGGDISKEHSNSVKTDKFKYPVFANAETNKGLHSYSDIYKISHPCLTVSGRGSLGNAVFRDEPFYPIVRLLVLKAVLPVDLKFYEYAINKLNIFNESTGVPQLTAPQLRTYTIVMPCIEEQKKIARAIESLDRKIDLVLLELEKAKEWKKGLLQQMFV